MKYALRLIVLLIVAIQLTGCVATYQAKKIVFEDGDTFEKGVVEQGNQASGAWKYTDPRLESLVQMSSMVNHSQVLPSPLSLADLHRLRLRSWVRRRSLKSTTSIVKKLVVAAIPEIRPTSLLKEVWRKRLLTQPQQQEQVSTAQRRPALAARLHVQPWVANPKSGSGRYDDARSKK